MTLGGPFPLDRNRACVSFMIIMLFFVEQCGLLLGLDKIEIQLILLLLLLLFICFEVHGAWQPQNVVLLGRRRSEPREEPSFVVPSVSHRLNIVLGRSRVKLALFIIVH